MYSCSTIWVCTSLNWRDSQIYCDLYCCKADLVKACRQGYCCRWCMSVRVTTSRGCLSAITDVTAAASLCQHLNTSTCSLIPLIIPQHFCSYESCRIRLGNMMVGSAYPAQPCCLPWKTALNDLSLLLRSVSKDPSLHFSLHRFSTTGT